MIIKRGGVIGPGMDSIRLITKKTKLTLNDKKSNKS